MDDQSKVKLVSKKGRNEYLALSYRWGTSQPLITTMENLPQMQLGIQISSLAKTIQDAILFCRKLEVRYLWVDALCIIQKGDGGADWLLESQKMALIYAQSYATIAAASARSSDGSFLFEPRTNFVSVPFRETPQAPPDDHLLFRVPSFDFAEEFEAATYESPLAKRAWVLQERLFSRRTIYFTAHQIYWECRSLFGAENGEISTPLDSDRGKMAATFLHIVWLLGNLRPETDETSGVYSMFLKVWTEVLDEYSELELTCAKDRLPAINGLARVASLVFPGRYLAGIWEHTLSNGLLWVPRKRPMISLEQKCAPSWSWASTTDAIRTGGTSDINGASTSRITLKAVLPSSDEPEILVLLGKIQPCHVSLASEPKPTRRRRKDVLEDEDNIEDYSFWPPLSEDSQTPQISADNICRFDGERGTQIDFFFLRLECSENMAIHHCRGLLLKRGTVGASNQISYTRAGIGWASHLAWHEGPSSIIQLK